MIGIPLTLDKNNTEEGSPLENRGIERRGKPEGIRDKKTNRTTSVCEWRRGVVKNFRLLSLEDCGKQHQRQVRYKDGKKQRKRMLVVKSQTMGEKQNRQEQRKSAGWWRGRKGKK